MKIAHLVEELQPAMLHAHQRLDLHGTRGINGVLAVALLVVMAGMALALISGSYQGGFTSLNPLANAALPDVVWMWITRLGDERLLLVLTLLFARRRPEVFWAMIVAALFAVLYSRGIKPWVDAPRPPTVLAADQIALIGPFLRNHSFPSGHTVSVFVFAGVWFVFARAWQEKLLLMSVAALVGLSRIALGVHWPQDILAGAFGGLLAAGLGCWLTFHWRTGLNPKVHLGLVILPLLAMPLVLSADNGNPHTPVLVVLIVFAMACQFLLDYRSYRK